MRRNCPVKKWLNDKYLSILLSCPEFPEEVKLHSNSAGGQWWGHQEAGGIMQSGMKTRALAGSGQLAGSPGSWGGTQGPPLPTSLVPFHFEALQSILPAVR